jgi:hypothetical protein
VIRRVAGAHALASATALLCAATAWPVPARAQSLDVSGYALGVAAHSGSVGPAPGGASLLGRARLMPVFVDGPFTLDIAYEHRVERMPAGGGLAVTLPGNEGLQSGGWLPIDWTIASGARNSWRHGFDRLSLGLDAGPTSIVVGRQAISWATTLLLTPNDPFAPFAPSDPFREYRGGVDAVRVRAFTGPFSELDGVVRVDDAAGGSEVTALARAQTSVGGWAVGGWAGVIHGEGAGAVFASGAAGGAALRGSLSVRAAEGGTTVRSAVGADRRVSIAGRDLYAIAEVQYDGFGAARDEDLYAVAASEPYLRGEMQTLGRWTAATQATYQLHPLVAIDALALVNLEDGSALLGPGASWTATASASLRVGLFHGVGGSSIDPVRGPASEYGPVPLLTYAALSVFF